MNGWSWDVCTIYSRYSAGKITIDEAVNMLQHPLLCQRETRKVAVLFGLVGFCIGVVFAHFMVWVSNSF